jgi:hypothetical protein
MMGDDAPTYWIDRCLGAEGVPNALRAIGVKVERYVDTYPSNPRVEDAVWIPEVTARGLVIVTKDKKIRRDATERAVLMGAKARYVCLATAKLTGPQQAECLVAHWRTIDGLVRARSAPLLVSVTREAVLWFDGSTWRPSAHKAAR